MVVLLVEMPSDIPGRCRELFRGRGAVVRDRAGPDYSWLAEPHPPDIAVVACREDLLDTARQIRSLTGSMPLVLVASSSSEDRIIQALRIGVNDFLRAPCEEGKLTSTVLQLCAQHRPTGLGGLVGEECMVGISPQIQELRADISRFAQSNSNVLITGETGTGKELVAQLVHQNSPRRNQPMVSVSCAAIPDSLLESELFGYERGAFTGAVASHEGKLQGAQRGTIFFDEIGDMSLPSQAKLLRAVESREFERLGSTRTTQVEARVVAATNRDLEQQVEEGRFRKDLYYRLNVARIQVPPLRERKEDIGPLLGHFITIFNEQFGRDVQGVSGDLMERIVQHDWPGNVRELRNLAEATFLSEPPAIIGLFDIPPMFRNHIAGSGDGGSSERSQMLAALESTQWNVTRAAGKLRWSRMTVYRKMAKHHIRPPNV